MTASTDRICEYLLGTCKTEHDAAEAFNTTADDVLAAVVVNGEIERCNGCDWWCESHELEIVDDDLLCEDCRDE